MMEIIDLESASNDQIVTKAMLLVCVDQETISFRARFLINVMLVSIGLVFLIRWLTLVCGE